MIVADIKVEDSIKNAIYIETRNPNIVLKYVDLSSFQSVREFAEFLKNNLKQLDILINNAGIPQKTYPPTVDGLNRIMQVNHYSAFLLTHLLVGNVANSICIRKVSDFSFSDLLKQSKDGARVIFTSSLLSYVHQLTAVDVKQKGLEKTWNKILYSTAKFCQISATITFAEKLQKYGITSNAFHPFISRTHLFRKDDSNEWFDWFMAGLFEMSSFFVGKVGYI